MYVYYLSNKSTPSKPFYIGMTKNTSVRLSQHKSNWQTHKSYISSKYDFDIHILFDTGSNPYNDTLAEKLEENFIKYFDTVNNGSNKVISIRKHSKNFFKNMWAPENYDKTHSLLHSDEMKEKRKKTRSEIKIRSNIDKFIEEVEPLAQEMGGDITVELILSRTSFKYRKELNNCTKILYNQTLTKWLKENKLNSQFNVFQDKKQGLRIRIPQDWYF